MLIHWIIQSANNMFVESLEFAQNLRENKQVTVLHLIFRKHKMLNLDTNGLPQDKSVSGFTPVRQGQEYQAKESLKLAIW